MLLVKLSTAASLITLVAGNPIALAEPSNKIAKRSEGIHLVNCGTYGAVVYCTNDSNCNFFPGAGNECVVPGTSGGLHRWEGSSQSCNFDSGTTFTWNINSDAQSSANYAYVGSGGNGFHNFNIFKDDQHVMYTDGNKNSCKSIYYCLDA